MTDNKLVLVTGAGGFLASHIVKQLLEQGYRVRGSVRNKNDKNEVSFLKYLIESKKYPLELVEADLLDENCWIDAVKDCIYVIHTASPVLSYVPDDENECVLPAVNGVLNLFKSCVEDHSVVERVVLTSSIVAVIGDDIKQDYMYTENDWGDLKTAQPYTKSKILAERAAWDFIEERKKANLKVFELATINPSFIFGPILHDTPSAVMSLIKRLLNKEIPRITDLSIPICDVRDCALAHIKCMTLEKAVSKRHIISTLNNSVSYKSFAIVLDDEFKSKGYEIPKLFIPNFMAKIIGYFDKTVKFIVPYIGKNPLLNNDRFIKELEIIPIDYKKSIIDMAYDIIEKGYVLKRY